MTPFVFSDGTRVPAGNIVCVPQQALMLDPNHYDKPCEFQGFRYVSRRDGVDTSTSRLSHPSPVFPFWGPADRAWYVLSMILPHSNNLACAYTCVSPGRFYVSMVVKLILTHFIKHYEIKLINEDAKPHFSWGINVLTHPSLAFLIRERKRVSA